MFNINKYYLKHFFQNRILIYFYIIFEGLSFAYRSGASQDISGFRFVSGIVLRKIVLIFTDFSNPALLTFNDIEFYGMLLPIIAYIISHSVGVLFGNLFIENNIFYNYDDVFYTFYYLTLIIYFITLIEIIYCLLIREFSKTTTLTYIILLYFIPSISGQFFFNIKDIPFALHIFIAFLVYFYYQKNSIKYNISNFQVIISFAFVLLTRINGIVFLFFIIFLVNFLLKKTLLNRKILLQTFSFFMKSILLVSILSPSAWRNPIIWIKYTFDQQFSHSWNGTTLTNGYYYNSTNVDINYLLKWFFYRLPMFYIILITIAILFLIIFSKSSTNIVKGSLIFVLLVLISFTIIKPTAYDGDRQYLFLYPFLLGISLDVINKLQIIAIKNKVFLSILLLGYFLFNYYGLQNYRYVYFNELSDEISISQYCETNIDGCGNWITDYQGLSGKNIAFKTNKLFKNKYVLVCRPEHVFNLYLNQEINSVILIRDFSNFELNSLYVLTTHRPRKNFDSCNNQLLDFECELIEKEVTNLRNVEINLSYLSFCKARN